MEHRGLLLDDSPPRYDGRAAVAATGLQPRVAPPYLGGAVRCQLLHESPIVNSSKPCSRGARARSSGSCASIRTRRAHRVSGSYATRTRSTSSLRKRSCAYIAACISFDTTARSRRGSGVWPTRSRCARREAVGQRADRPTIAERFERESADEDVESMFSEREAAVMVREAVHALPAAAADDRVALSSRRDFDPGNQRDYRAAGRDDQEPSVPHAPAAATELEAWRSANA